MHCKTFVTNVSVQSSYFTGYLVLSCLKGRKYLKDKDSKRSSSNTDYELRKRNFRVIILVLE